MSNLSLKEQLQAIASEFPARLESKKGQSVKKNNHDHHTTAKALPKRRGISFGRFSRRRGCAFFGNN